MKRAFKTMAAELHLLQTTRARAIAVTAGLISLMNVTCGEGLLQTYGVLIPVLLISTATDLSKRVIPNWLMCSAFAGVILLSGVASLSGRLPGLPAFPESLRGAGAAGGLMLLCSRGRIGGGDVKLAGVIGATLGPLPAFQILMKTCVFALVFMVQRMLFARLRDFGTRSEGSPETSHVETPMAGFFLLATLASIPGAD
jgi:Flp pilus assembly protein protease CpaA